MLEYSTGIDIDASPLVVWDVLMNTGAWPQWDPFCERIEAPSPLEVGSKVKAFTKLAPGRAFGVKVSVLDYGAKMVWTGGMPFGLFKGERTYALRAAGRGTRFTMREVFSGPMLKLIGGSIPDMNEPFAAFAAGLKARAEEQQHRAAPAAE